MTSSPASTSSHGKAPSPYFRAKLMAPPALTSKGIVVALLSPNPLK